MFDRIVAIDWSARSSPARGRDSIWIAVEDGGGAPVAENLSTRALAEARLRRLVDDATQRGDRVLVAIDVSLGYPVGTADALDLTATTGDQPWAAMWRLLTTLIVDHPSNHNNRFEVAAELNRRIGGGPSPFWGCPPSAAGPTLTSTKPAHASLAEWRHVEAVLRARGRRPSSSWQLLGAGSVGSQSLLAIPVLERLRRTHRDVAVWPFETPATVTIAEMWPSLLEPWPADVRDEGQVLAAAAFLRQRGTQALTVSVPVDACDEEGWVIGVEPHEVPGDG
ncbi:MAG: cobalamin biosynthesis protein CbiG [Actinomycetota bacterium]